MKTKPASSLEKHQWQKAFKWLLWKGQQQRASDSEHLCPIYLVPKAVQERCFFAVLYTWCGNRSEVAKHFFSDCNCLVIWGNNGFNKVCSPTQYQEELQPVECYTIVLADNWLEISHIYYAVMFFFCLFVFCEVKLILTPVELLLTRAEKLQQSTKYYIAFSLSLRRLLRFGAEILAHIKIHCEFTQLQGSLKQALSGRVIFVSLKRDYVCR